MRPEQVERFWSRVATAEGDGCWLWTGSLITPGYGRIKIDGKGELAHRVAYQLVVGPIPEGLFVCHHCDVRSCVRPSHLFVGTQSDNIADAYRKGRVTPSDYEHHRGDEHWTHQKPERAARGERVGGAKLTADDVREIRRLRAEGLTLIAIAGKYGVRLTNIHQIVTRATWKHVE